MQLNLYNILIVLLLMLIDFCLQNKINEKGNVFLYINKSKLRYPILALFASLFIFFILKKQYLSILCLLYVLRIGDKLIYLYKK